MSMIIAKKTAAETKPQPFRGGGGVPKTVKVAGILVAETIAVNEVDEDGAILPARDTDGVAIVLSATNPSIAIYAPITLQFVKGITVNAVGVMLVD